MHDPNSEIRPGLARAERRERELLREWFSRLDEPPLRAALSELMALGGTDGTAERLAALADSLGIRLPERRPDGTFEEPDTERGVRAAAFLCGEGLRLVLDDGGAGAGLLVEIQRDTVRITEFASTAGLLDRPSDIAVPLDEALMDCAGTVLRWLRGAGEKPAQASRLAALFAPRRRDFEWPSSPS